MKIVFFGSGGIGGYFGARLAAAGEDVHFIARGSHLEAMKSHGLRVKSPLGDVHIEAPQATDDPATCGPADLVVVGVKLYDTEAAAVAIKPLVGPETTVVSFQNGVFAGDVFSDAFGRDKVIGGSSSIATQIQEPGVILHTGTMASIAFGEWDGEESARTEAFLNACKGAGIDATVFDDINAVIWSKFVFLSSFSGITCRFKQSMGPIREDPEKLALFRQALEETFAVAIAKGVTLKADLVDKRMAFADGLPAEMYASMYHDLVAGKRLELPWLSGAVVDMGRQEGIETPAHQEFTDALTAFADGGAGK
jgi:2-dehydropantoate 2-reductase